MSFEILVIFAGLVVGYVKKGTIWNVANLRVRVLWMLPIPYLLQHISVFYLHGTLYEIVVVVSYVLLITFCVLNVRTPGVLWALVGTAANFVALCANGLRMPAYLPAVQAMAPSIIPALKAGTYGKSIAMSGGTHLNFLCDIFAVQLWPGTLLSIGDILFCIGLIILIQHAMRLRNDKGLLAHAQA